MLSWLSTILNLIVNRKQNGNIVFVNSSSDASNITSLSELETTSNSCIPIKP